MNRSLRKGILICAIALCGASANAGANAGGFVTVQGNHFAGPTAQNQERYYAVPLKSLELLNLQDRPVIIKTQGPLALVKLNPGQVNKLALALHAKNNSCGGFSDVQVFMERFGATPEQAMAMSVTAARSFAVFDKKDPSNPNEAKLLLNVLNAQRMWTFLGELASFPDRSAYTDNGVKAAKWLADRAMAIAGQHQRSDIQALVFNTGGSYKQPSIVIRVPGADPKLPGVLVGGHMDTLDGRMPGADDDGTGSATVMEIYTSILDAGLKFKRDIYFAFYAAEERGLVGSKVVASEFKKRGIPLRAVLQFDMTGFKPQKDTKEFYFITDYVSAELTNFLVKLTQTYVGIPAQLIGATRCGYACSDHASWTSAGYESAFPSETSFDLHNRAIHTSDDKMDILNVNHAAKYMKLGGTFVVETADPIGRN